MGNLEDFINKVKIEEEVSELSEQTKDSRASVKDNADKKLREYVFNKLKSENYAGIDYNTATPDNIDDNHIEVLKGMARQDSAKILYDNRDDVISKIEDSKLEKIAMQEEIVKNIGKDYGEYLDLYKQYLGTKDLADRYKAGKVSDPKELQLIRSGGAKKAQEEIKAQMKSKGYSRDLQEMAGNLALLAARDGYLKNDYVEAGANQLVQEAEKELRDYETAHGKKGVDYVRDSLKKLVSGKTKEFEIARSLIYAVAK